MRFLVIVLIGMSSAFGALSPNEIKLLVDKMEVESIKLNDQLKLSIDSNSSLLKTVNNQTQQINNLEGNLVDLNNQIKVLSDWGVAQQTLKNQAYTNLAKVTKENEINKKKVHAYKFIICGVAALAIGLLIFVLVLKFGSGLVALIPPPYNLGGLVIYALPVLGAGLTYTTLYLIL